MMTLCAAAVTAQSSGGLLEQAIFAENTAGDLDGAIRIYERLLNTPGVASQLSAVARTRLNELRARREQRTPRAAHAQQATPVTGLPGRIDPPRPAAASPAPKTAQPQIGCCGMFSGNYDETRPIVVSGTITSARWENPLTLLFITGRDGNRWGFTLPPPNSLILHGLTRDAFKVGEAVTVSGFLARGTQGGCQGPMPHACATLADGSLHASASTVISDADGRRIFDGFQSPEAVEAAKRRVEEMRKGVEETQRALEQAPR
jgi:hypothetical protein